MKMLILILILVSSSYSLSNELTKAELEKIDIVKNSKMFLNESPKLFSESMKECSHIDDSSTRWTYTIDSREEFVSVFIKDESFFQFYESLGKEVRSEIEGRDTELSRYLKSIKSLSRVFTFKLTKNKKEPFYLSNSAWIIGFSNRSDKNIRKMLKSGIDKIVNYADILSRFRFLRVNRGVDESIDYLRSVDLNKIEFINKYYSIDYMIELVKDLKVQYLRSIKKDGIKY